MVYLLAIHIFGNNDLAVSISALVVLQCGDGNHFFVSFADNGLGCKASVRCSGIYLLACRLSGFGYCSTSGGSVNDQIGICFLEQICSQLRNITAEDQFTDLSTICKGLFTDGRNVERNKDVFQRTTSFEGVSANAFDTGRNIYRDNSFVSFGKCSVTDLGNLYTVDIHRNYDIGVASQTVAVVGVECVYDNFSSGCINVFPIETFGRVPFDIVVIKGVAISAQAFADRRIDYKTFVYAVKDVCRRKNICGEVNFFQSLHMTEGIFADCYHVDRYGEIYDIVYTFKGASANFFNGIISFEVVHRNGRAVFINNTSVAFRLFDHIVEDGVNKLAVSTVQYAVVNRECRALTQGNIGHRIHIGKSAHTDFFNRRRNSHIDNVVRIFKGAFANAYKIFKHYQVLDARI